MRSSSYKELSTTRRRDSIAWGPATDAPTYLPATPLEVDPSESIESQIETLNTAHRAQNSVAGRIRSARAGDRRSTSDSIVTSAPRPEKPANPRKGHSEPSSRPAPLPDPPSVPTKKLARGSQPGVEGSPRPQPRAQPQPQPQPKPQSQPQPELAAAPFVQFPNGGAAFDPLALPLPPELSPSIYSWLRRLALQADLAGADRLLRDALADLTSSLSVVIIYAGPDGFYTMGAADEMPKEVQPLVAVAKARRALVSTHTALVPIVTATETVAVVQLQRNARQPAFGPNEYVVMAAFGRETTGVMHHLVVDHLQKKTELARDKGSLYRPEALESHRKRGTEGVIADLSPGWVRGAYPMLCVSIVAAVIFATCVKVPTYSTGKGIVVYPGTIVVAPAAGSVSEIYAKVGDRVKKGQPLVRLSSQNEEADLKRTSFQADNAVAQFLIDSSDEQIRKTLTSALAEQKRAQEAVDQRVVRAPRDGVVAEFHIEKNRPVNFGDEILEVADPDAKPQIEVFLPGNDLPRIQANVRQLQVQLEGYPSKGRDKAAIVSVDPATVGAAEVRRLLGAAHDGIVPVGQDGNFTVVRAELPARTFKYHGTDLEYRSGMQVTVEAKLESKRFIVTLLPDLAHIAD